MAFRVGQKVVCINDAWGTLRERERPYVLHMPVKGCVYTVRGFVDGTHLLLEEIVNPVPPAVTFCTEACWLADYFRPLVERKTDISIFQRMLKEKVVELNDA